MTPAEKKKAIWMGGALGVLALYSIYTNFLSEPSAPATTHTVAAGKSAADGGAMMERPTGKNPSRPKGNSRARNEEFNPPYLTNRVEDRPDPSKIDPTLRLDYFSKVQEVDPAGGKRNLFAFGQPPPPPQAKVEPPKGPEPNVKLVAEQIAKANEAAAQAKQRVQEEQLHTKLKYYGIVALSETGVKTACLLDKGEEIVLATEGETVLAGDMGSGDKKFHLRVTKITTSSLTVQDTDSKKQETIQLASEAKERS